MQYNMKQFDSERAFPIHKRSGSSDFFQRFGLCGTCELVGLRGLVAVSDFQLNDKIVTRKGFATPLAIAKQKAAEKVVSRQTIVALDEGCLGDKIPQRKTVLGGGATARRYLRSVPQTGGNIVNVQGGSSVFGNHLQDCADEELYLVIFLERTEVQVHGIYVTCPGVSDVKDWLQDRAARSVRSA